MPRVCVPVVPLLWQSWMLKSDHNELFKPVHSRRLDLFLQNM